MAINLVWNASADGSLTTDTNWKKINIRNGLYSWTASGSGTNEYYLRTAASADPALGEPATVYQNAVAMTPGTAGSLAASEWDWADNDTLGYSTVYVRLSDGADPDSKADGFVEAQRDPITGDVVQFISNTFSGTSGLDNSGVTLFSVDMLDSFSGKIGTATGDEWHINITTLDIGRPFGTGSGSGTDRALFDLGTVQSAVTVWKTKSVAADSLRECVRIRGTNSSNVLTVLDGLVGIATNNPADVATFATSNLLGGRTNFGTGCTLTTITAESPATYTLRSAVTTLNHNGGTGTIYGSGAITTDSVRSGTQTHKSTGTVTTMNVFEGATVNKWSGAATISTLNLSGTLDLSEATSSITITNTNITSEKAVINDPLGRAVFSNAVANNTDVRSWTYIGKGGSTYAITA